ncbi:MAG TPA: acyl-CoA dehydrogenase family protein [Candidatus Binatia bacterium]|jgi:alkylation response protein AidB-like acyl-CoA dehydrogenase|nr:acyl-CoA dehydrogenase family protein [Candidatus Binatia bacterium]
MDFELTQEQAALRQTVRDFAQREIATGATERDEFCRFPHELIPKMAELGLFGIMVPESYGGAALDALSLAVIIEEIAAVDAAVALMVASHNSLSAGHIGGFGSEGQKRKFLVPLARGEKLAAWALTEPEAGSDAQSLVSRAMLNGNTWVLNGEKAFITQGSTAGVYVIMAATEPSRGREGISAFIVERERTGLEVVRVENKLGVRASDTAQIRLDNVQIPKENLLGELNCGYRDAMTILDGGRIGIGAMAVGIARAALKQSIAYAKQRRQFGKPIAAFEAIQWKLADMATEIDAARLLVYHAADLRQRGQPYRRLASEAKLFASEVAMRATKEAIQVHGGAGYMKSSPVERYFRDAKICEIGEGTSEVQRMVIARQLLRRTDVTAGK